MAALESILAETRSRNDQPITSEAKSVLVQSHIGLNAVNFFLAEVVGVVMPFLGRYLKDHGWGETAIGFAIAVAGLGVFLAQTPAGLVVDRVRQRRSLLAIASIIVGTSLGLLPLVPATAPWIDSLLLVSGVGQAFFAPLLGALALGLVGHAALNRTIGMNQSWNHAGNIAAAALAMILVGALGVTSIFYTVFIVSVLAAGAVFLIRSNEIDEELASGQAATHPADGSKGHLMRLLRDRRVVVLLASTALFHLANAPVMPFIGTYISKLGGTDVQIAAVVLVAQVVMIPVALMTGWLCDRWGRKPIFAIGFLALPIRIFLYSLTDQPWMLVALQALDGIGAGVYGVAVVAMCADLTRHQGGFNTLQGMIATALALGGVIGPVGAGWLAESLGYNFFFYVFTGIAGVGAALFLFAMPETREAACEVRASDRNLATQPA